MAHHCVIQTSKGIIGWGNNYHHQCVPFAEVVSAKQNVGNNTNLMTPILLSTDPDFNSKVRSIFCGRSYTVINTIDGVHLFGNNTYHRLELPTPEIDDVFPIDHNHLILRKDNLIYRYTIDNLLQPTLTSMVCPARVLILSCGREHNIMLSTDGVYVWGSNRHGQLAIGHHKDRDHPTKINIPSEVLSVHAGLHTTFIVSKTGLYVSGLNKSGQLGLDFTFRVNTLTLLKMFANTVITKISTGETHTMINTVNGLFVMGSNTHGQLGLGDRKDRKVPVLNTLAPRVDDIICGAHHTIIRCGECHYSCGWNEYGQLGVVIDAKTGITNSLANFTEVIM